MATFGTGGLPRRTRTLYQYITRPRPAAVIIGVAIIIDHAIDWLLVSLL